ncbi:hypothetical protein MCP1_320048 [Candidatus Terasakiella magnetica]|nr:hypothetical protein MCP1_320048 [Candidatus Terasakiella magnetica]
MPRRQRCEDTTLKWGLKPLKTTLEPAGGKDNFSADLFDAAMKSPQLGGSVVVSPQRLRPRPPPPPAMRAGLSAADAPPPGVDRQLAPLHGCHNTLDLECARSPRLCSPRRRGHDEDRRIGAAFGTFGSLHPLLRTDRVAALRRTGSIPPAGLRRVHFGLD